MALFNNSWLQIYGISSVYFFNSEVYKIDWGLPKRNYRTTKRNEGVYISGTGNYGGRVISFTKPFFTSSPSTGFEFDTIFNEEREKFLDYIDVPIDQKIWLYRIVERFNPYERKKEERIEKIRVFPSPAGGEKPEDIEFSEVGFKLYTESPFFEERKYTKKTFTITEVPQQIKIEDDTRETYPIITFIPDLSFNTFEIINYYGKGFISTRQFEAGQKIEINFETGLVKIGNVIMDNFFTEGTLFTLKKSNTLDVYAGKGTLEIKYKRTGL